MAEAFGGLLEGADLRWLGVDLPKIERYVGTVAEILAPPPEPRTPEEAVLMAKAEATLRVLRARFGAVPGRQERAIEAEPEAAVLDQLLSLAATCGSLEDYRNHAEVRECVAADGRRLNAEVAVSVLERRFGPLPPDVADRVRGESGSEGLMAWMVRCLSARDLDDLLQGMDEGADAASAARAPAEALPEGTDPGAAAGVPAANASRTDEGPRGMPRSDPAPVRDPDIEGAELLLTHPVLISITEQRAAAAAVPSTDLQAAHRSQTLRMTGLTVLSHASLSVLAARPGTLSGQEKRAFRLEFRLEVLNDLLDAAATCATVEAFRNRPEVSAWLGLNWIGVMALATANCLEARFPGLPADLRTRILAEPDGDRLEDWMILALEATDVEEFIREMDRVVGG